MRLEDMIGKIPAPIVKGFVVGGNIVLSSAALYRTIQYAQIEGEMKKAICYGIGSLILAFVAGYHTRTKF